MRFVLLLLLILPAPSLALEFCDELWFTRNLIFHQAGHCFGSPLGKAVFGNQDCDEGGVTLSDQDAAFVKRVREAEAFESCKVDSNRTGLAVPAMQIRMRLVDPPFPSLYESGCFGWLGKPLNLYSGHDRSTEVMITVRRGDNLLFQFEDEGDWSFVELVNDGIIYAMGWAIVPWGENTCEMAAG